MLFPLSRGAFIRIWTILVFRWFYFPVLVSILWYWASRCPFCTFWVGCWVLKAAFCGFIWSIGILIEFRFQWKTTIVRFYRWWSCWQTIRQVVGRWRTFGSLICFCRFRGTTVVRERVGVGSWLFLCVSSFPSPSFWMRIILDLGITSWASRDRSGFRSCRGPCSWLSAIDYKRWVWAFINKTSSIVRLIWGTLPGWCWFTVRAFCSFLWVRTNHLFF